MQQFESARSRVRSMSPRSQWVQLGLLSASVVAPLISRWNDLRALEYTQSLREEAEQRIKQMRALRKRQGSEVLEQVLDLLRRSGDHSADPLPLPRSRSSVTRLWVIGATVGLVAAGAGTFVFVRRRLAQSNDEPLVNLPLHSSNGASSSNGNGHHSSAASATNGTTPGARASATPAATPATPSRAEPSPAASTTPPATSTPAAQSAGTAAGRTDTEAATTTSESAVGATGVVDAESAPFIGNIRTMVFHEADADNLPAEDNRVYFASEAEARSAGYRRDRDELTTAEAEAQASE